MQPYVIVPSQGSNQEDEWIRLGVEAQSQGKLPDAQRYYQQALRLDPRNAIATQNLAIVFAQSNLLNEALLTIERSTLFDEKHAVMHVNRALMCLEADRIEDALSSAEKAIKLTKMNGHAMSEGEKAGFLSSRLAKAMTLATAGKPEESIGLYNEILSVEPAHAVANPNSCFVQTLTFASPKDLLERRKGWYEANRYKGEKKKHDNDRSLDRPLRVGYVGGDFKTHSAAMIFGSVILNHDKASIVPYLYCSLPVDPVTDGMTKKFKEAVGENWRDISGLDDEKAEALIRQDRIDILVDLAGHTNGGRLPLFTRKPAPVQITAWGFAHGTGVPEIDYFLADPVAVPQEEREFFAEKIWDVPSIVSYLPPFDYNLKEKSQLPYHQNGYITFGSYARYEKISSKALETFAEILRRVPDSRIQFKDHAFRRPYSIKRIMEAMPDIAPERLLFSISTSHPEHMLAYQQADMILDPFPHGGGVVSLESLFMGVPIVTLYGPQPSGRTASSVLTAMGFTDWIAKSPEQYIDIAAQKSKQIKELKDIRSVLRTGLLESPVVKGYPQAVEKAYRDIWKACR